MLSDQVYYKKYHFMKYSILLVSIKSFWLNYFTSTFQYVYVNTLLLLDELSVC